MYNPDQFNKFIEGLNKAREKNLGYYFVVSEKFSPETVVAIENYLIDKKLNYETRECKSCKHTWDIIVFL